MFCELMLAALLAITIGSKIKEEAQDPVVYDIFEQSRNLIIEGPIPADKEALVSRINSLKYLIDDYDHKLQYYWDAIVMPRIKEDYLSKEGEDNLNFYVKCRRGLNRARYRLIILNKELEKHEKPYTTICGGAPSSDSADISCVGE
jgi:hypothetical protein